eukprot:8373924-Karenia_brevis.AAC.1
MVARTARARAKTRARARRGSVVAKVVVRDEEVARIMGWMTTGKQQRRTPRRLRVASVPVKGLRGDPSPPCTQRK